MLLFSKDALILANNTLNLARCKSKCINVMRLIDTGENFLLKGRCNRPKFLERINVCSRNTTLQVSSNILRKSIINFRDISRNVQIASVFFQHITVFHETRVTRNNVLVDEGLNNFLNILFSKSVLASVLLKATAGINQENTFSCFRIFLVNDDNTSRNASSIKKVRWQTYDALDISFLQNFNTDSFFSITSEQNTMRHNNTCLAVTIQRF